jgi:hypothetical protein
MNFQKEEKLVTTRLHFPEERELFTCLLNHPSMNKNYSANETKIFQYAARLFAKQSVQAEGLNKQTMTTLGEWKESCITPSLLTAALRDCACINKPKRSYLDILEGAVAT